MSNKNGVVQSLIHNYQYEEKSIVSQLYFKHDHHPTIGVFREQIWKKLFEDIVPRKFVVEQSIFILDSNGQVSNEVDLAIIDEMYTPYIFRKGQLKFIPIEAVAVAIQCKSISSPSSNNLGIWTKSIKKLKTAPNGIARMATNVVVDTAPTQKSTRPILIYCHLGDQQPKNENLFDISICATKDNLKIELNDNFKELSNVYLSLNFHGEKNGTTTENSKAQKKPEEILREVDINLDQYRVTNEQKEVSLLSFNFILNQVLMLLNNPMLFPHKSYVKMFNGEGDE